MSVLQALTRFGSIALPVHRGDRARAGISALADGAVIMRGHHG